MVRFCPPTPFSSKKFSTSLPFFSGSFISYSAALLTCSRSLTSESTPWFPSHERTQRMSQDDSGIIFSTILHSVPTSIPYVPSLGKDSTGNEAGAATPINFAYSQTASRNSIGDGSSYNAILITNATSIGASLCVIAAYYLLRRKHARLMKRTTLKLSLAMAMTDLVFHVSPNVP